MLHSTKTQYTPPTQLNSTVELRRRCVLGFTLCTDLVQHGTSCPSSLQCALQCTGNASQPSWVSGSLITLFLTAFFCWLSLCNGLNTLLRCTACFVCNHRCRELHLFCVLLLPQPQATRRVAASSAFCMPSSRTDSQIAAYRPDRPPIAQSLCASFVANGRRINSVLRQRLQAGRAVCMATHHHAYQLHHITTSAAVFVVDWAQWCLQCQRHACCSRNGSLRIKALEDESCCLDAYVNTAYTYT